MSERWVPCEAGVPPLPLDEAQALLAELGDRQDLATGGRTLTREITFKTLRQAMAALNRLAELAERVGHHPDLCLNCWNHVSLTLTPHALGGHSRNDFVLAAKVESLPRPSIDVATVAIAQQRACGVDEMTGGETSADRFILHFPRVLSGMVASENTTAWGGRGTFRIIGPISAPQGLGIASAFGRERRIDPHLEKVTIPGPSEITTMLEPREAAREAWPAVIELIRAEIRALVDMGARDIQLDVPQIAMGLADGGWDTAQAVDAISAVFDGVHGARRSVHLCYGDFGARTWARHRELRPLIPTLQNLSGIDLALLWRLQLREIGTGSLGGPRRVPLRRCANWAGAIKGTLLRIAPKQC